MHESASASSSLAARSERESSDRRLLLVSYHFGVGCATGGFRWNAAVGQLCAAGWHVDVLTLARPGLEATPGPTGPGTLRIVPVALPHWPARVRGAVSGVLRRLRVRSAVSAPPPDEQVDPAALFVWRADYRRSLRERIVHGLNSLESVCAELGWAARAVRAARPLLAAHRYRAVVVSSPPHLTHAAGMRIAREGGLRYIADFRDPWTLGLGRAIGYLNDIDRTVGRYFETRSLRRAHSVIHNTERARTAVAAEFRVPGHHHAICNGYDDIGEVASPDPKCFRITYTGHLYAFMDVRPLFAACARLRARNGLDPDTLRIDFVGTEERFEGVRFADLARAYRLGDVFEAHSRVSRSEAAEFQQTAAVLVAYDWLWPTAVVSKFYEYARMKGALLLLGHREGALADAAARLGVPVLDPADQPSIDRALEEAFARWKQGAMDLPNDPDRLFARSHQNERIREVLESL